MSITKEITNTKVTSKNSEVNVNENEISLTEVLENLKQAISTQNFSQVKYLCSQIPPNTLDKEFVDMTIQTRNARIADVVFEKAKKECFNKETLRLGFDIGSLDMNRAIIRHTDNSFFDKEILNSAINAKSYYLVQDVVKKTAPEHFDREILQTALNTKNENISKAIIGKTPNKYFDKEILMQALQSKDFQLVRSVVGKTESKYFDKEVLDFAISTKNGYMVNDICSKTDAKYFDQDTLYKSIDSGVGNITKAVAKKTPQQYFDKEALLRSIKTLQGPVVNAIAEKADNKYFDKDLLITALETKNGYIVHSIADKTDKSHFDKNILMTAVQSKIEGIVRSIGQKSDKNLFDKQILNAAVDTKVPKVVYACGKFADSKRFDKEILEKVLSMNNAEMVRSVVDHMSDKKLFVEYKKEIQHAILKGADIQNLTAQILSRRDNQSFDREMQELVMDIYMDVITDHFKKGTIPSNFPMKQFEESMAESRFFFSSPDSLNLSSLNEKNRFLLLPVFSYGHAYSAVVRKLENDNISITFVNLGARPFEKGGSQYKEYVYTPEKAMKVLKDHSYSVRIHYPEKAVDTNQAYRNFKNNSLEEYTVNVTSRDQKVGNCFLKNIEKGIRYALALGLSQSADKNFDPKTLRVTAESNGKLKVKFLKPFHKPGEKTNDLTTLELREQLIKSLLKKFPQYEKEITQEWNIYKKRKERTVTPTPRPDVVPIPIPIDTSERKIARQFYGFPGYEKTVQNSSKEKSTKNIASSRNFAFIEKMQNMANNKNSKSADMTKAM